MVEFASSFLRLRLAFALRAFLVLGGVTLAYHLVVCASLSPWWFVSCFFLGRLSLASPLLVGPLLVPRVVCALLVLWWFVRWVFRMADLERGGKIQKNTKDVFIFLLVCET